MREETYDQIRKEMEELKKEKEALLRMQEIEALRQDVHMEKIKLKKQKLENEKMVAAESEKLSEAVHMHSQYGGGSEYDRSR